MVETITLGIDYGTSNSAVATYDGHTAKLFSTSEGHTTQPSAVFIRVDGYTSTGLRAIKDFLAPHEHQDTYHFIPTVKPGLSVKFFEGDTLLPKKSVSGNKIRGRFFPVEELASIVIKDLKLKAEEQSDRIADRVVIGRPVFFSSDSSLDDLAQQRLEEAAKLSGFSEIQFIPEPIAAALYYERTQLNSGSRRVLVFDYGGGTLDTSVLELQAGQRITPQNIQRRIISTYGIEQGGTDLDKAVFERGFSDYFGKNVIYGAKQLGLPAYIFDDLPEWHLSTNNKQAALDLLMQISHDSRITDRDAVDRLLTLIQDQQVFSLLQSIEGAKIALSNGESSDILFEHKNISLRKILSQEEFNQYTVLQRRAVEKCVRESLRLAQMDPSDIDVVLRVGGSSKNRFARELLENIFDNVEETDPMVSVVAGLAIAAHDIYET